MELLVAAVSAAGVRSAQAAMQTSPAGALLKADARRIELLAEDLGVAVAGLTDYARSKLGLYVGGRAD
jgi:hypothetical protein